MSIVVSGILCCFKLALPSLLFLLWDEAKAAHYDFDHCSHRGSLHPENPSNWQFFHPKFKISDHCNLENDSILTFPVHYTSNKCFPPAFPILPLSAYSFDVKSEHGSRRSSGPRWIFSFSLCTLLTLWYMDTKLVVSCLGERKLQIGRILLVQTTSIWTMVTIVVCNLLVVCFFLRCELRMPVIWQLWSVRLT